MLSRLDIDPENFNLKLLRIAKNSTSNIFRSGSLRGCRLTIECNYSNSMKKREFLISLQGEKCRSVCYAVKILHNLSSRVKRSQKRLSCLFKQTCLKYLILIKIILRICLKRRHEMNFYCFLSLAMKKKCL